MTSLPCTTIAGRHAADRQRLTGHLAHAAACQHAFDELARALRRRFAVVHTDFRLRAGTKPTIALGVRADYAGLDQVYIDAHVRECGFRPHPTAESRLTVKHDMRALVHKATHAELLLIITLPYGVVEHVEAA